MAPAPDPEDVRIKVAYAGICGSDRHNYKTAQWITRRVSTDGHEFSDWIDDIGSDDVGLESGDKLIADSYIYCGTCRYSLVGSSQLCQSLGFLAEVVDNGFADYISLPTPLIKNSVW